ncbi:MAG: hypothetical protein IJA72_03500 [Clostridia bacterium]|nr:hypothetical protein [Clostridia bacterium]
MKKHIIAILVITLILSLAGVGIYFVVKNNKKQSLYNANSSFVHSEKTEKLIANISKAESLYQSKVASGETRLTTLHNVIIKLDSFEKDLNSYLILASSNTSTSNKLAKKYQTLTSERDILIDNYNEYITRMEGNINIDGNSTATLYNEIFDKTVQYVYNYNACFESSFKYIFEKIYKAETIKSEFYSLYTTSVIDLLNNISNHQFSNISLITLLNDRLNLDSNNNVILKSSIDGGEYSSEALKFKKHFRLSNINTLIETFKTTNPSTINPALETSNEKLAVYYALQILEA